MSTRYQVTTPDEYGDASVLDTLTNEFVQTNSGHLYVAPQANAQWTADSLNKTYGDLPEPVLEGADKGIVDEDGDDYTPEEHVTRDLSYGEKVWLAVTAPNRPEFPHDVVKVGQEVMVTDTGELGTVMTVGPNSFTVKFGGTNPALDRFIHYANTAFRQGWLAFPEQRATKSEDLAMVPASELEAAQERLVAEQDRSQRRHERTLDYAGKLGKATADLSAVRSRLVGLTKGMLPSMRERGVEPYRTADGALFHALDLIESSLEETLAFLAERIEEHRR